jgi:tRNA threonylcarbamoyl adenosine modification protein (Sua5/YciO/YrdC/YwlC family)
MTSVYHMDPEQLDWQVPRQAAERLRAGGLVAYPTDTCYALGCLPQAKSAIERIYVLRQLKRSHDFTLLCPELKVALDYVKADEAALKILKEYTPGPYTFILPAQPQVPAFVQDLHQGKQNSKTMGIRIPDHPVITALLELLGQPMVTSSLQLPGAKKPLNQEDLTADSLNLPIDIIIEAGPCLDMGTTIVDLTANPPVLVRQGAGPWGIRDFQV